MAIVTRKSEKTGKVSYYAVLRVDGRQQWKLFQKKKDAESWLKRASVAVEDGTYTKLKQATFFEYLKIWRTQFLTEKNLKPSTLASYNSVIDHHLLNAFKKDQRSPAITNIKAGNITTFRSDLQHDGQSPASIKKILNLLNHIFSDAIDDGYLKTNPMPKRKQKSDATKAARRGRALQAEQVQRLLAECDANIEEGRDANPELRLMILIALLAGLRRSEVFALDWPSIDFVHGQIKVSRNLFWKYGRHFEKKEGEPSFVIHTPKSAAGTRSVDMSETLRDELWNRQMDMQMEGKLGLVFQSRTGTPYDSGNILTRWFDPAVKRAVEKARKDGEEEAAKALTGLHFHDLRHTFGSAKIHQGEDVLYVSKQLGHANPSITLNIYSHLLLAQRPAAAKKTDEYFFGKKPVVAG